MEFFLQLVLATTTCAFASFVISSILRYYRNQAHKYRAPEIRGAWPIVGHLPLLAASKLPHKLLASMADTYGPIFIIRLGVNRTLVISSSELARECLLINDKAVSERPKSVAGEVLGYNYAMFVFSPYGSYWRDIRKIVALELLSNHRIKILSNVWKSEIKMFVNDLYATWSATTTTAAAAAANKSSSSSTSQRGMVDLRRRFKDLAMNIIVRIIAGKKFGVDDEEGLEFHETAREFLELAGAFVVGDALPFLRRLDLGGHEKAMKNNLSKLDNILQKWLDEHKQRRSKIDQDFMDVMLSIVDHDTTQHNNYDVDTISKATCLAMILGGSDTTPTTMTWVISLLLDNPHELKRAQDEVAAVVGKDRLIDESDIPRLVYLQAIVKETLRLYPPVPLVPPREFNEDCTIGGYYIEAGTRLIVNNHKVFRDPQIWEDPLEFRPERFLSTHKDVDFRGKNFELIPFGAGRRICPGISFGLQVVHLALGNFLHAFEFSTPSNAPVDMREKAGLTSMKAEPLNVLIAPTLPFDAYV